MDVIQTIMVLGVSIIGIAIVAYTTGLTLLSIPVFKGGVSATGPMEQAWNATMLNISANSVAGMQLSSISPLVLGAALVISILLGVFVFTRR